MLISPFRDLKVRAARSSKGAKQSGAAASYRGAAGSKLFLMPEDVQFASPKNLDSFANLLATFTGKLQDEWDNSALAEDVATLSYDKALRQQCQTGIPEPSADSLHEASLSHLSGAHL